MTNVSPKVWFRAGIALAVGATLICASVSQAGVGQKAPAFSATGSDGKTHTLASLTKGKTLFLYFIKSDCPVNQKAAQYYVKLADAYKGKVNFIGVINGDDKVFKAWKKAHKPGFVTLLDPSDSIIKSYGAERSPWMVVVTPKGTIQSVHKGYSVNLLSQINSEMAKAGKAKAAKLSFRGAPATDTYG